MSPHFRNPFLRLTAVFGIVCLSFSAHAANLYWDGNDTTTGAGATPTGTWGSSTFWSTDSTGATATTGWIDGNTAVFSAGTDGTGTYTVTVTGTQSPAGLTFEEGVVTLSGGTVALTSPNVVTTAAATISSAIGGTVGLTKTGAATLTLSGTNTYSGTTAVNAGTITVTGNQSAANGSWVLLGSDGTTPNTNATTVNFNTGSTISIAAASQVQAGNSAPSGGFAAQTINANVAVTNAGALNLGRAGVLNIANTWTQSGSVAITSQGGGTANVNVNSGGSLVYTGAAAFGLNTSTSNTTTTGLTVTAGTFTTGKEIRNSQATVATGAQASVILNNGGVLKISADIADLITTAGGTANVQVGATGTGGTINTNGFSTTLSRPIINVTSQAGKLVKTGSGTLTLSGTSTYTGGTTLSNGGGVLALTNGSALGTGAVAMTKTGVDTGGIAQLSGGITVANAFNFSSATGLNGGGTAHIRNASGTNILSGALTLTAGGGNGINLQSDAGILTINGNIASSVADASRTQAFGGAGNGIVNGIISNNSSTNKVAWDKLGTGTWTFNGTNTISGNGTVRNGTLLLGNNSAMGGSAVTIGASTSGGAVLTNGAFTIANSIQFNANPSVGTNSIGGNTDNNSTFSGAILMAGNGTISQVATTGANALNLTGGVGSNNTGTRTLTFAGPGAIKVSGSPITNGSAGAVAVTVTGGAVTFSAANTYTGDTRVEGGSLTLSANSLLADASTVEVHAAATLALNFTGTDKIKTLTFDGVTQSTGTWGAIGSGADHTDARITGTGILLVVPTLQWNSTGGDGLWSTAGNWDILSTPPAGSVLLFPGGGVDSTLANDLAAGTTLDTLRFLSGAAAYTIGGTNKMILTGGIENLSTATQSIGFPIEFGANVTLTASTGKIALSGDLSGGFGFTKAGTGALELSGTNTYTGTTTLAAGSIKVLTANSLPATTTLAFTNTTNAVTLDLTGVTQTVAGMTFGTQTSGTNTVSILGDSTTSLTTTGATLAFSPLNTANNLTVDMSSLGAFAYNNASGSMRLDGGVQVSGSAGHFTTLSLSAESNTITAANFVVGNLGGSNGVPLSTLNLGRNNTLNVANIGIAASLSRSSGIVQFGSSVTGSKALTIRGTGGGTSTADMNLGSGNSFQSSDVDNATFDTSAGSLDAMFGTVTVARASTTASGRGTTVNGTFKMGAGTMSANSVILGTVDGTGTGSTEIATALLDLNGGTAGISTLTFATNSLASGNTITVNSQVNLGGGAALNATTIQQGTVANIGTLTTRINWNDGTIGNLSGTDLAIGGVSIVLGSGTHTFAIGAGHTGTVSSVVSGTGSLTKSGAGTLVLGGVNTYTGDTVVTEGVASLSTAFLADTSTVSVTTGGKLNLNFSGNDTVAVLLIDGLSQTGGGTTYGATGSGANVIDDVHFSGAGKIQVGVSPDPFTPWMDGFTALSLPADKAKSADPDHDGLSNLAEFALDGDPSSATNTGKVRVAVANVSGDNVLTITLPVRLGASFTAGGDLVSAAVDGVVYKIQGSTDMVDFTTTNVTEVTPALISGMPGLTSGWEYRTFRLPGTVTANPKGFLRAAIAEP
ncbi:autotransporter-associated beta strand repeat-containing protein [Luteolibacter sp. LG18]|uniref:beta strand repeat-containing protein n=1 Tax=Luteolibacter sp. LG18 TaxID=2819286 RepID=UPI0030C72F16